MKKKAQEGSVVMTYVGVRGEEKRGLQTHGQQGGVFDVTQGRPQSHSSAISTITERSSPTGEQHPGNQMDKS